MQDVSKSLGNKSLSAVFWGGGGSVLRILLQFGAQVVLARILGPEQYGLFAIGAIVISFSSFLSDIGLAYGLIQKKNVDSDDIRFVFTWQIILGLVVSLSVAWAAEDIAEFFGDARSASVVKALAIVCLFNAVAAPSLNLLKRQLDFKRIQLSQILAFITGYVLVGIPLAWFGAQVWALIAAWFAQALVTFILLYRATHHPLQPLLWYHEARALFSYGGTVLITNLVNWFINNIDRVIVGRVFSSQQIGLYATSYNMLYAPTSSLLGVIQPVFFSASARVADQQSKIDAAYRALLGAVAIFILPVFTTLSAVAETFIFAVYGPKWAAAVVLFRPFALAMPLFLVWGFTTPLLWSAGYASREFRSQLPVALLWAIGSWWAASNSAEAVAWVVFVLFGVRCAVIMGSAVRVLHLDLYQVWKAVRGGLFLSLLLPMVIGGLDTQIAALPALLRLALDALAGGLVMVMLLRLLPGIVGHDLNLLIVRILDRCPAVLAAKLMLIFPQGAR